MDPTRRNFLHTLAATGLAAGFWPRALRAASRATVVVVGGGFAGATAAKYLRVWAPEIEVVLIEPNREWISCPLSNRVLAGSLSLRDLKRDYGRLAERHGVKLVHATVTQVDPARREVRTDQGERIAYDRLIVAPGVDFVYDDIAGLQTEPARERVPHAWKAGPQTLLLRKRIADLPPGGVVAIHIPKAPFRCPPGPYERASMIASYLTTRNPKGKVLVFDANPDIQSKKALFSHVWGTRYPGMVEYVPNADLKAVDATRGVMKFDLQGEVRADCLNVIPPQRAGGIAYQAGLVAANERWCRVGFLTYESVAARGIHVIGDSVAAAPGMPKSGHMANQQAKVCAGAVAALISGTPVNDDPIIANTCYSFVGAREVIHVASVHRYDRAQKTMLPVKGAGGVSSEVSTEEALFAVAWGFNLMNDVFS
ncbi:MAG: NAD(P)/FAD-dependent oxidoreductase [Burkholderiales bacterium]|nr:NAD(P)/FAD-dependent oxidoreductase [Burkholderiales bacterium]